MSLYNRNAVSRWFAEVWGEAWNPDVINELGAPGIVLRNPLFEPVEGRSCLIGFIGGLRTAFPDLSFSPVGGLLVDGNYAVQRWKGGGTHTGPAYCGFRMGSLPAASRKTFNFAGTTIYRLDDGYIAEEICQTDGLTAMLQLGLIRLPELQASDAPTRPFGELPHGWTSKAFVSRRLTSNVAARRDGWTGNVPINKA